MNSLIWLAIAFVVGIAFFLWMAGYIKRDGANQQKDKDTEAINGYLAKLAPDIYDGNVGTDALGVRDKDAWGEDTGADPGERMEPDNKDETTRGNEGR